MSFVCGAFGGVAPTLLKLAGKAQDGQLPGGGYYLAMAIFALIGGGIALIYKEQLTHKAFLLGVGAPALIVAGNTVADSGANRPAVHVQFFSVALAAQNQAATQVDTRMVMIQPDSKVFQPNTMTGRLMVRIGEQTQGIEIPPSTSDNPVMVQIPKGATAAAFEGSAALRDSKTGERVPIRTAVVPFAPGSDSLLFEFSRAGKPTFWAGWLDGIGLEQRAQDAVLTPATVRTTTVKAVLSLDWISTVRDGSGGTTGWLFDVSVNNAVMLKLPNLNYSEKKGQNYFVPREFKNEIETAVSDSGALTIAIQGTRSFSLGTNPDHATGSGQLSLANPRTTIQVSNADERKGSFLFQFSLRRLD